MNPHIIPDIERCLPHCGAMRWLERVVRVDEHDIEAVARVRPELPFADASGMPSWAGIEFMAQAVAAWAGARALARGESPRIGFLLGTRRYRAQVPTFAIDAVLHIKAHCELFGDNGMGMFSCRIVNDGRVLAEAQIAVFEPPDGGTGLLEASA